jgi:hypothetical protein
MLASDKHSSSLQKFVNYGRKKFYRIGPRIRDGCKTKELIEEVTERPGPSVIKLFCPYFTNFYSVCPWQAFPAYSI